jgi:hypothetical protein
VCWCVLVCVSTRARNQFPSVRLQPLGHLSVSLESAVSGRVDEPETPNCVRNCVRPPNVLRSLTGTRQAGSGLRACLNRMVPWRSVGSASKIAPPSQGLADPVMGQFESGSGIAIAPALSVGVGLRGAEISESRSPLSGDLSGPLPGPCPMDICGLIKTGP